MEPEAFAPHTPFAVVGGIPADALLTESSLGIETEAGTYLLEE